MAVIESHDLNSTRLPGVNWAVAVAQNGNTENGVALFLAAGTDPGKVAPGADVTEVGRRSIGGAPVLFCQSDQQAALPVLLDGENCEVSVFTSQSDIFAGLNVGVAIRNGEDAQVVADWLAYHRKHHDMNAALIVNRSQSDALGQELAKLIGNLEMARIVILAPDFPLGRAGLPDEAHPYCAPDAPGKDRMDIPLPDPWRAPLGELVIYELLKALYLGRARAVANIDVCDLVVSGRGSMFDTAVASESGLVMLAGRYCYPWRVRKNQPAGFGDHICVQFDRTSGPSRWCFAPDRVNHEVVWRYVRVVGADADPENTFSFMRFVGLRHRCEQVSKIVPKSSLVENAELLALAGDFGHKPARMPELTIPEVDRNSSATSIVTTMKNEGPFILEWLAYHRVIGVKGFLIYTNDCTDGTDHFLALLQQKGLVQHRDNNYRKTGLKPQHSALKAAMDEPVIRDADWVICMDVDEYINIKVGDGTLADLYAHMGDANMISCTWRLFGNGDIHGYSDAPVTKTFDHCAPEMIRKPHQAWGFKTLFRNVGIFRKLGVHRPKGLNPQLWDQIKWVNGSGKPLPPSMFRNAWRSTLGTFGYDVVSLNHYAVRSAESFLVKRERGRVNHVNRDQGLNYWFRMNNNAEREVSIQRMLPKLEKEMQRLLADPDIAAAHGRCVAAHREKITELRSDKAYADFYSELTSDRMQRLSRMHHHFGANVFSAGPQVVPDEVADIDNAADFFFTLDAGTKAHQRK